MTKIVSTIWEIEPHTEAKHEILRKYLDVALAASVGVNSKVCGIHQSSSAWIVISGIDIIRITNDQGPCSSYRIQHFGAWRYTIMIRS